MKSDTRLSSMLHLLLHMGARGEAMTSAELAGALRSNPVVVRRVMAGLRAAGIVQSDKGHGGGWTLRRPLAEVTFADVYRALGSPRLFALGNRNDAPSCLVEQAVNDRIAGALAEAEATMLARFGSVTLADIAEDFETRLAAHPCRDRKGDNHV